jgi:enamine deaminase RidA (YjgF/YER057c/UK114 family)
MLATVRAHAGSLDSVDRIVKVLGFVNATPEFHDHPKVMNGFSDLMVQIFGDAGLGARSAVGAPSLPSGIAVEVEAIFRIA